MMSKVIAGEHETKITEVTKCETSVKKSKGPTASVCICGKSNETSQNVGKIDVSKITEIVENIIKSHGNDGKTTIKINIEINKE